MEEPFVIARRLEEPTKPRQRRAKQSYLTDINSVRLLRQDFVLPRNDIRIKYDLNKITINAKTDHSEFLVLNNNLNENWRVKINGKEGKHFQANLLQRAVFLPKAGNYLIEFYYYPKRFIIGGLISGFALLIVFYLIMLVKKN